LFHNGQLIERQGYTTDIFTRDAVDFIMEKGDDPFFLYVAYNGMLPPYSPPGREADRASFDTWVNGERADYVAAVEHLDKSVGQILHALDTKGLADDTAVVLCYDHGGGEMATPGPFFHGFGTLWEGGIRVPMALRWPGGLAAGGVSSEPVMLMDVTTTLLAAAGIEPDQMMDGMDLLGGGGPGGLGGPSNGGGKARTLYWRIDLPFDGDDWGARSQLAVRRGKWKYLKDGYEFLYDLDSDPGERQNLAYQHPELLAELRELAHGDWELT
jgi:arylsulfatase A-like enzyme